jgi:3-oxoadipate enol-lactonase
MWDGEIERHKAKHCVLAYDTRGHGQSAAPKGPYTLEALADDLQALLKHLKIEKPHYVGLSMGGMIGQTAALKYPGIFPQHDARRHHQPLPGGAAPMWEERIRTAESKGMAPLVQPTLERWFTEPFRKNHPEKVKQVAALIANTPVAGYAGCCAAIPKINVTSRLKELKTPTLVICGENDPGTPPAMAREIQQNIAGREAGADPAGGSPLQHRAARGVQSRSCGLPFIPCQRVSLAECTPKRSRILPTVCATRSSIDFGMA